MKRLLGAVAGLVMICALIPGTANAAPTIANGGGHGTVDGVTPFSQFGFGITLRPDGSVQGSFNCLMAGASQFPGFTLMAVRGQISAATIGETTASFDGAGMFQTGNQGKSPATFHVVVAEGGPGVGTLQLTLLTPMFFPLPTERVLDGQIRVH